MNKNFQLNKKKLVVIGAGPGGYAAAFLAADLGIQTTLIDSEKNPGGVCLYRGCIPSKALLHLSKLITETKGSKNFGLEFSHPKIDLKKVRSWKEEVVSKLTSGLGQLVKQRKIEYIQGYAAFKSNNSLEIVSSENKNNEIEFDYAVIATGSKPALIKNLSESSQNVIDSTSALDIENIPENLLIVGGGYIGLELGTVYSSFGSNVTVAEMLPGFLNGADRDLVAVLSARLNKMFEQILVETRVTEIKDLRKGSNVIFTDKQNKTFEKKFDKILISAGRKPDTHKLRLENTGVKINEKGFIITDNQKRTSIENIFAIGDVSGEPMLAHKASHEGRLAVEVIAGSKAVFEPQVIPAVVFTDPEIAWCGLTESEAKDQNLEYAVSKFPWAASGRALTLGRTDGLTKLIIDKKTQRILGAGIVGVNAGDLISEAALAIEMGANASDVRLTIHPHPTLSETIMESAEVFFGQSTYVFRPKK